MHELGTLVWIILIVIGVVSSIAKKAREGSGAVKRLQQRQTPRAHPPLQGQSVTGAAPVRTMAPPPVQTAPAPVPVAPPVQTRELIERPPFVITTRTPPRPAVPAPSPQAERSGTAGFRGMFERGNLVRAIVAAEVLGPPKALQEHSIWSPRHSEPSI